LCCCLFQVIKMSNLATLRTRDGQSYKMPADNVTKGALDSVFGGNCRVIECNGIALAPCSNGVFVGAQPGHTYTVYMEKNEDEEDDDTPTRFGRIGRKLVGRRHVPTREETRKVFVHYDRDGSGAIDMAEFRALVATLGLLIPAEEVENTFRAIDLDNSGTIEFEEFYQWFHAAKSHKNNPIKNKLRKVGQKTGLISITDPEVIRRAFMSVDADGNGTIDPQEFRQCCINMKLKIREEEAKDLFEAIDLDGNGTLEFSEFLTWWNSMTRGNGKKTLLAHNIHNKLFEKVSTELAEHAIIGEKKDKKSSYHKVEKEEDEEDEEEFPDGNWSLLSGLGEGWKLPEADSGKSQAAWYKENGVVLLRGCLLNKDDDAEKEIATLPECARPSSIERFQCMIASVKDNKASSAKCHSATVIINPDGSIALQSVHQGELWLSGISFTIA